MENQPFQLTSNFVDTTPRFNQVNIEETSSCKRVLIEVLEHMQLLITYRKEVLLSVTSG